jgi:hypothetical protein
LPGKQRKTFTVTAGEGALLAEFVTLHGQRFQNVVSRRQQVLGESTRGQISDLPNASVAASFLSQLNRPESQVSFVCPPGLDLSGAVGRGTVVLLAWAPDSAPIKPLNQFTPRRQHRQTLWRVAVDVSPQPGNQSPL